MKQIVLINRDETSRMKLKRCKIQDVAYQDEKLRMQQIGAIFSCLIEMLVVNLTKVFRFRCQMESFNRWHFCHHLVISKSRHFLMILRSFFSPNFLNHTISTKFSKSTFFLRIYFFGGGIWHLARVRPIYRSRRLIGR